MQPTTETINAAKRTDLMKVDPRSISIKEGFNVRFDYGDIESLKESIVQSGLKMPLRGYVDPEDKDRFILTDGHRRLKAINLALEEGVDIARVPFMKEEKGYKEEQRTFDLIICNDGKKLDSLEEAEVIGRLINFGYSVKEISEKTGRSLPHTYNMVKLSNIDKKIKNYITEGKITSGAVIQLILFEKDTSKHLESVENAIEEVTAKVTTKEPKSKPNTVAKPTNSDTSGNQTTDDETKPEPTQVPKVRAKDLKVGQQNHLKILKDALAIAKANGTESLKYRIAQSIVEKLDKKVTAEELAETFK